MYNDYQLTRTSQSIACISEIDCKLLLNKESDDAQTRESIPHKDSMWYKQN